MNLETYLDSPLPFEAEIDKYFEDSQPSVIFDIGACEGEDSIRLHRKFPNATIYSFEPLPKNIEKIKRNFKTYGLDEKNIHDFALSDKDGSAIFYVSSGHPESIPKSRAWDYGNKSSSLLPPKMRLKSHEWLKFKEKITVKTQRLDGFCKKHSIEKIDFAFIDVQGAELMVLEGAGDFLQNINAVWLEVEAVELYAHQPLKDDIEAYMTSRNFIKIKDTVGDITGDQLYVRSPRQRSKSLWRTRVAKNIVEQNMNKTKLSLISLKGQFKWPGKEVETDHKRTSFSQTGEDLIIKSILDNLGIEKPVYVDIGAHHPRYINNTAIFYDAGATGINIEPDPALFQAFLKSRPLDINLNIGVSPKSGELDFYLMSAPTLNTFSLAEVENFIKEGFALIETTKVQTRNINEVIKEYLGAAPDFINLDAEGVDFEILQSFNFKEYSPAIWCVETISFSQTGHGVKDKRLIRYLEDRGYLLYADTNINSIFIKENLWRR